MTLTLKDIVTSISSFNDEDPVFAKKIDGKFLSNSEAIDYN